MTSGCHKHPTSVANLRSLRLMPEGHDPPFGEAPLPTDPYSTNPFSVAIPMISFMRESSRSIASAPVRVIR